MKEEWNKGYEKGRDDYCCNGDCNQGRNCPLRKINNEPVAWTDGKGNYFDKRSFFPVDDLIPLYTHLAKTLTDEEIIESLAELEHEQWMAWAKNLKDTEALSIQRLNRWIHCFNPYSELSEEMKEHDRVWARKALAILRKAQEK